MNIQQIENHIEFLKSHAMLKEETPFYRGFLDMCEDCLYACSLSETALVGHLKAWLDFIPETEYDKGYMMAHKDIMIIAEEYV